MVYSLGYRAIVVRLSILQMTTTVNTSDGRTYELSEEFVNNCLYFDAYQSSIDRGMLESEVLTLPFSLEEISLIDSDIESLSADDLIKLNNVNEFLGYTNHSVTTRIVRCWYTSCYSEYDKNQILQLISNIVKTNDVAASIIIGLGYNDIFPVSNDPIEQQIFYTRIEDNISDLIPLTDMMNCIDVIDRYPKLGSIEFVSLHINDPRLEAIDDWRVRSLVDVLRINSGHRRPLLRIFDKSYDNRCINIILRYIKVTEHTSKELVRDIILSLGLDAFRYRILASNIDVGVTDILVDIIVNGRLSNSIIDGIVQHGHTDLILELHRLKIIRLTDHEFLNCKTYVDIHSQYNIFNNEPSIGIIEYILHNRHKNLINRDILYKFFSKTDNVRPIFSLIRDNEVDIIKLIPIELIYGLDPFLCGILIKMGAKISNLKSNYKRIMTKEVITFFINNGYVIEEYPEWLFNLIRLRRITTEAVDIIRLHLDPSSIAIHQLDRIMEDEYLDHTDINYQHLEGSLPSLIESLIPEPLRLYVDNNDGISDEDNDDADWDSDEDNDEEDEHSDVSD